MATSPKSRLHNRKRRYTEAELSQEDIPSKRFKPPLAFWDNLSKIPLTRSALKELERRYSLSDQFCAQTKVKKPRTRSAVHEFKQKAQPAVPVYLSKVPQANTTLLKSFARQGGPDLTNLRGYSRYTMSSSRSSSKRGRSTDPSSATSKSKRSTTTYDRGFEQNLIDHGVYLDNRAQTPENSEEIKETLANPRPSLSPSKFSESAFKAFQASDFQAKDEDDVMIDVIPVISGVQQGDHFLARKTKFGNLDPLTDGTLVAANPDLFYGARPEQLNRQIRDKLSSYIIPSTMEDKPMAPNFYLEAKGPDGSAAVARRQACYDGAIGARGLQSLQSYGRDELVYDNCAYTIASTYHDGTLKIYSTYITPPAGPRKRPEYQMTQVRSFAMTDTIDTFRQGATAFRNGRDLAKKWRDGFILAANERVDSLDAESPILGPSNDSPSDTIDMCLVEESETSADELTLASTLFSHPLEEPETSDELIFTSFSANEPSLITVAKPTASENRPGTESKNVSRGPQYGGTSKRRGQFKKDSTVKDYKA